MLRQRRRTQVGSLGRGSAFYPIIWINFCQKLRKNGQNTDNSLDSESSLAQKCFLAAGRTTLAKGTETNIKFLRNSRMFPATGNCRIFPPKIGNSRSPTVIFYFQSFSEPNQIKTIFTISFFFWQNLLLFQIFSFSSRSRVD
jgi:hypothetical protein